MRKILKEMTQNRKQSIIGLNRKQTKKNQLHMKLERKGGWDKGWVVVW